MRFFWEQGALLPSTGDSCESWLLAHINPLCAAEGGWQLSQPADLGKGSQIWLTFA